MVWVFVTFAVVALVVVGTILSYNRFVSQRNLVQESWRQIEVELHRRYDLIPNLVQTVRTYASHERRVFEDIARLRAQATAGDSGSLASRAQQESALAGALRQLFAVVENYPALKSNQNFVVLQQQLAETEDRIAAGRRFYNANVRAYNTRVEAFPSNLIASNFGFAKAEYFEVEEAQVRAAPQIDFSQLDGRPGQNQLGQHGRYGRYGQQGQPGQYGQPGQDGQHGQPGRPPQAQYQVPPAPAQGQLQGFVQGQVPPPVPQVAQPQPQPRPQQFPPQA